MTAFDGGVRPPDPTAASLGPVVIVGAGPAGLTAAYELTRRGVPTTVFDQDERVGGLAQTAIYRGFRFDLGGHRFFTKVRLVRSLWREMLGDDLLTRPRMSRIYYDGRFFPYPLKALPTLKALGLGTSLAVLASYGKAKIAPIRPEVSFEDWITNKFGRALYLRFFKSYTEKVWGIPCRDIGAQWAAQRIAGLSLRRVLANMLAGPRGRGANGVRTLIDEFEYPRLGPGMMWEAFHDRIVAAGGRVALRSRVVSLEHDGRLVRRVVVDRDGVRTSHDASHVIVTMPIRELVPALTPSLPAAAGAAASRLAYRDFVTVAVIIRRRDVFPDNWIYVHDPSVRVGRIQNFKNWSPEMVPDPEATCLGLEYFCTEGDDLWGRSDAAFIDLARQELAAIGLARPEDIVDGAVLRAKKAYPVYDSGYLDALAVVREHLRPLVNLQLAGRNGLHKYNNQDHSMLTAILAVRNLAGERHDVWAINAGDDYHEDDSSAGIYPGLEELPAADVRAMTASQPIVPRRVE